jgi:carnosine N-methyltransferase
MAAGDFLDVYNDAEYVASLDVVVTCFFMDCAHNILDFMQTIHRVREHTFFRSEGTWIQCCGSGMFIPDTIFFHPGSWI